MKRFLALILFFGASCDKPEQAAPETDVGSFFSDEILGDSVSAKDTAVPCAGASEAEQNDPNHPAIVRGSVFAPPPQQTGWSLFNSAYAVPIDGEVPRAGVRVTIGDGKKTWRETTTDPLGRFCLRLSFSGHFGPDTIVTATIGDDVLRRFVPTRDVAIVSTQSEAVVRLVSPLLPLSSAELINLQTMADTRVDLATKISATADVQGTVMKLVEELQYDPRIRAWIAKRMTKE